MAQVNHQAPGNSGQNVVVLGRGSYFAVDDGKQAGMTALERYPISHKQCFEGTTLLSLVVGDTVGQKRYRLDIAAGPSLIGHRDGSYAHLRIELHGDRRGVRVDRWRNWRLGERVGSWRGATSHLDIDDGVAFPVV